MKKVFVILVLSTLSQIICAQNIQLHYDFGSAIYNELDDRPKLTTTIEFFKPDKWGSTFFFVDMDYADNEILSAYWEIARELSFWKEPFSIHVEYDGGLNYIKDSYLGGVTYTYNDKTFNKGFTLSALYKYIHSNPSPNSFQLTATWYINFCNCRYTFTGYADFWRERHTDINGKSHLFSFMAEPQFWVNLNTFPWVNDNFNLSVGTEWEISSNFALMEGWYCNPTVALKWTF